MFPVAVGQRFGEERILRRTHPVGQLQSGSRPQDLRDRIAQRGGFEQHAGFHVRGLSRAPLMEDQVFVARAGRLRPTCEKNADSE